MLFAVEGGGFFSSSASGYSKGLALLLLGQKSSQDKPMRVSPWNQYQLVDQESDPDLQLAAPPKSRLTHGCASFVCFRRSSSTSATPASALTPPKVGAARNNQDSLPGLNHIPDEDSGDRSACPDEETEGETTVCLKSSLKKPLKLNESRKESVKLREEGSELPDVTEIRKVQWTDTCGNELAEIKEFEPSEMDFSDDEFENGTERSCSCTIM